VRNGVKECPEIGSISYLGKSLGGAILQEKSEIKFFRSWTKPKGIGKRNCLIVALPILGFKTNFPTHA